MEGAAEALAALAVVAIAPLAIVLIVALLRGYQIKVELQRRDKQQRDKLRGTHEDTSQDSGQDSGQDND